MPSMYPEFMHEESFWTLVKSSPEWVAVFASSLFAIVTTFIIWRQQIAMESQVNVMKKQGEISAEHQRVQNVILRLQHEHDWLLRKNAERKEILNLVGKLRYSVVGLDESQRRSD